MNPITNDDAFRRAAELEVGSSVSAGARIIHVRTAAEEGRAFYVDLSAAPEARRAAVMAQIREIVDREGVRPPTQSKSAETSSNAD